MLFHSPLAVFIAQAAIIIVLSRVIGVGARRLSQPIVIAEIVAGIVLGPSLLGAVAPTAMTALFPSTSLPLLGTISQLGLLLFMFLVGLELDPKLLKGRAHASVAISHTSIVVPCLLGGLLGLYLYPRLSTPDVPFASFVMFMGVSMSVTAFPVLARILSERRLLQSKVGAIAITCAAVDDVTAWCLLAFVVSIAKSTHVLGALVTVGAALVYIVSMLVVLRPILVRVAARSASRDALTQNVVAITLLMLLASSLITEVIGIHALFGGFMLGAIMPKEGLFARLLAEKLEDVVVVLLLPMFFAYSGLRTQIGLLDTPQAWIMCAFIIVIACVGKFGGSVIAGRLTGLRWREASAVGILMNTRGLMELIVLNIGLDLKVISPMLFTMLVIMALVTTFMTTPLLEFVYPLAELAQELEVGRETSGKPAQFTALMCVAYERSGPPMINLMQALVSPHSGSHRLYALRLIQPSERASFYLAEKPERSGLLALQPLMQRADELRLSVRPLAFVSPRPAQDICEVAEAKGANLVVLGWHKPVLARTVLGGTVAEVLDKATSDVAIFIDRGLATVRRVLVPFQGTPDDKAALALARRMTVANVEVTILHVIKPGRTDDERLGAQDEIEHTFTEDGPWKRTSVRMKLVSHDKPATAAIEESARGYDLVVVGAGHEWGLERRMLGLAPELMVERCAISLLVVRQYDAARASAAPVSAKSTRTATVPR